MPRGRRKKPESVEEEILLIDTQIAELTKKLQAVKTKKKKLIKNEAKIRETKKWEQIRESGYSADDILNIINHQKG